MFIIYIHHNIDLMMTKYSSSIRCEAFNRAQCIETTLMEFNRRQKPLNFFYKWENYSLKTPRPYFERGEGRGSTKENCKMVRFFIVKNLIRKVFYRNTFGKTVLNIIIRIRPGQPKMLNFWDLKKCVLHPNPSLRVIKCFSRATHNKRYLQENMVYGHISPNSVSPNTYLKRLS